MSKIFVGNMSFQTSEDELRSLFQPFGEVTSVSIPTDRDTGRVRGFAFVEMSSASEASNAISGLNGKELNGRQLRVNEAQPKGDRDRDGGGGRGRKSYQSRGSRW